MSEITKSQSTQALAELLAIVPQELRPIYALAHAAASSGYFPDVQRLSQAVIRLAIGERLGLTPLEAFTGIYFVNGRLAMSATLLASRIKSSGRYDYRVEELTEERCVIRFYERGPFGGLQEIGTSEFTMEDAAKAGLLRPGSAWEKYPRNMLFARALSNGARWFCPDAVFGAHELSEAQESIVGADIVDIPELPVEAVQAAGEPEGTTE